MLLEINSPSDQTKTFGYAHSGATTSKEPVVIGGKVYIPLNTAGANERNAYAYSAVVEKAPKKTAEVWTLGQPIYWAAATKEFTNVAGADVKCGYALGAAGAGTVAAAIDFNSFA